MRSIPCALLILLFISSFFTHSALAATIHIPTDQPTIQDGIDVAADGDLVLVDYGIYYETIDFHGKAITLRGDLGPNSTFIDGDHTGSVVTFSSGETEDAVIDGFTIREGSAERGGGIFCTSSTPTIKNCTISDNSARERGAGIFCDSASPKIMGCTITENDSVLTGFGGGIFCYNNSSALITDCRFIFNGALGGAGICCLDSSPSITNCNFSLNLGLGSGAIDCRGDASPTITHCTFTGNAGGTGGMWCMHSSSPTVTNCIFWNNPSAFGAEIYLSTGATLTVSYSDVMGGEAGVFVEPDCTLNWLEGNINSDPLFALGLDYHLGAGSPCIDTGIDTGIYTDIDGDARPQGAGFDMGADEVVQAGPCASLITPPSHDPSVLYLIPALALIFLSRRFVRG